MEWSLYNRQGNTVENKTSDRVYVTLRAQSILANIGSKKLREILVRINIGCLNINRTHVTAYNSTNNNVVFFLSDWKIV